MRVFFARCNRAGPTPSLPPCGLPYPPPAAAPHYFQPPFCHLSDEFACRRRGRRAPRLAPHYRVPSLCRAAFGRNSALSSTAPLPLASPLTGGGPDDHIKPLDPPAPASSRNTDTHTHKPIPSTSLAHHTHLQPATRGTFVMHSCMQGAHTCASTRPPRAVAAPQPHCLPHVPKRYDDALLSLLYPSLVLLFSPSRPPRE